MCRYMYLGRRTSLSVSITIIGASLVCDLPNVRTLSLSSTLSQNDKIVSVT